MTDIDLVVFDMAGTTLYDGDTVLRAFEASLAGAGVTAPAARINAVMGLPKRVAVRQLLAELGRPADEGLVNALHDDFVARMKAHYATGPGVRPVPGAAETFAALRARGCKVALNTGFSRDIVDVILPRLGWGVPVTVDAVVTSDEVARGRPHPDMIRHLMATLGVRDAARVAKVGDTTSDLDEGSNAGCGVNVGVLTGANTRAELAARPHTHLLDSVADLLSLRRAVRAE